MAKKLIGAVEAASFKKSTLEKVNNASTTVFVPNRIYVGWAQKVAKPKGVPEDKAKKFLILWEIDPVHNIKEVVCISRSKFGGLYVNNEDVNRDETSGKNYISGYKEEGIYGKKIKMTSPVEEVFKNGCGPLFRGTEDGSNPESDGPMFVIEPFAFVCTGKEPHFTTMPVKNPDGNWTVVNFPDSSTDDPSSVRVLLLKKQIYMFNECDKSISELCKEYDLYIPKEASETSLTNPEWFAVETESEEVTTDF